MRRSLTTQFHQGCDEVHIIFDNPGRLKNTSKHFEHLRRDKAATISDNHSCVPFNSATQLKGINGGKTYLTVEDARSIW